MRSELERFWYEVLMSYFKILSWHSPGGTEEKDKKILSQESQYPDEDCNQAPHEYKLEI
jgi:hypothetical protein